MINQSKSRRIRYAVVGAGWFGQAAVLPAFANAKENSELAAIVSGDIEKRAVLSNQYGVPAFPLNQLDDLLAAGDRRGLHRKSKLCPQGVVLLAASCGVHVLCEKPLADTAVAAER